MKLTEEQRDIVEKNHDLIYWYIHMKGLSIEEWYGLLAIELCLTVAKYKAHKGSLANYFKLRADNMVSREFAKLKLKKNAHGGMVSLIPGLHDLESESVEDIIGAKEIFEVENGAVLKLKAQGYTQSEIADYLGVTQSYISKILTKAKEDYYDGL